MPTPSTRYYWNHRKERKAINLAHYYANREAILEKWKMQRAARTPKEQAAWIVKSQAYQRAHYYRQKAKRIAAQAGEPVEEPGASYRLKREI